MPPEPANPLAQRLVTTAEVRRFEQCRLAWWYDRTHPLAQASADELRRRMDLFLAVYGPGARELPEYRLLADMEASAQQSNMPLLMAPASMQPIAPLDRPQQIIMVTFVIAAIIIALVLVGIFFAVLHP